MTGLLVIAASLLLTVPTASAASPTPQRGLSISPVRKFVTQDAGANKDYSVTVGNFTAKPMVVDLSVKSFSVNNYSYGFTFDKAPAGHIKLSTDSLTLKPNESKVVKYTVALPADTAPGGRYYTIFATGIDNAGKDNQQIQTTSLIYLTVKGELTYTSKLNGSQIGRFTHRSELPYSVDVTNTGNIHYPVFVSAELTGLFGDKKSVPATRLLMPGKPRKIENTIAMPVLPGLYNVSYGYDTEHAQPVLRSAQVLYIPPWSLAAFVILAWAGWIIIHHLQKSRRKSGTSKPQPEATDPTD